MIIGAAVVPHPPMALPEVGHGEEKIIPATIDSYQKTAEFIARCQPEVLIVSSPHAILYRDYFNVSSGSHAWGSMESFGARQVSFDVAYDEELTETLDALLEAAGFPGGTAYDREKMLDHGVMVPLYYIRKRMPDLPLVRLSLSGLSLNMHYQMGQYVQQACDQLGRKAFYLASGDLAHCQKKDGPYGWRKEGEEYDARIMQDLRDATFAALLDYDPAFLEKAMECGHRSFVMMAGALDGLQVKPHYLSHENITGVGYGFVTYEVTGTADHQHILEDHQAEEKKSAAERLASADPYVQLAYRSIVSWIRDGKILPVPDDVPEEMLTQKAGAFVSIHEHKELRGCIGTISPVRQNLAKEIIYNAISASTKDPRFNPITEDELPYLEISVDVLGKPERILRPEELDVHKYGVICTMGGRRGLLLPDLEGVDTVQQQIDIACRKGGIAPDEPFQMERFEVVRHV